MSYLAGIIPPCLENGNMEQTNGGEMAGGGRADYLRVFVVPLISLAELFIQCQQRHLPLQSSNRLPFFLQKTLTCAFIPPHQKFV